MISMILFVLCLLNMNTSHQVNGIRVTLEDLPMQKLINNHILTQEIPGSLAAGITLGTVHSATFYGVSGTVAVYNPKVQKNQSSAALMWVRNGPTDSMNLIGVGWHVAPHIYNDDKTHLYAVWTKDSFKKTGCYNLLCPGFVQTDKTITLGSSVDISRVQDIALSISKDSITGNWLIYMFGRSIGYFPASLFSNMSSADQVGWGGATTTSKGTPSPPMGSGFRPQDPGVEVCYFRNVSFRDVSKIERVPKKDMTQSFTDKLDCYGAEFYGDAGVTLAFGGPGGKCSN